MDKEKKLIEDLEKERKERKKLQKEAKLLKQKAKEEKKQQIIQKTKEEKKKKNKNQENHLLKTSNEKDLLNIESSYNPKEVEANWYDWWIKKGYFTANNKSNKEKFVMVIPPPNVTGILFLNVLLKYQGYLHLGHALSNSIEDAITRWNRMCGKETLWLPGTDHAGIATQVVVEKKLAKEQNLTRHDIGREKFIEHVWKWKNEYGSRIINQLKRLGSSLDWSREVFTMDDKLSYAVKEAFIRLFNKGLIYRDIRLVNWCCKLKTAISDIEVDHINFEKCTKMKVPGYDKEIDFGFLLDFAYKIDGLDEEIIVSTTRPETMLGDTAVAVHPNDSRYQKFIGKMLIHPFIDRKIPIIADPILVNMEFGTGAVKVTPAHDPNDFECGKRNNLNFINILNDDGTMNENAGPFKGLKRYDARNAIMSALKEKNLFRGIKDNPMSIGICSRSKDIIEPMLKPQWWVNCQEMAKKSIDAVKNGELEILPHEFEETWYNWLENIRDWCISRQLWWGHRVPAYLICIDGKPYESTDNWVVGHNIEEAMKNAINKLSNIPPERISLEQDPDVLDTWFSSGLFPFSVFGWPNETEDFKAFYPTTLLETGHDILFFWVARMVMMGIELTGTLPFKKIFLHAIVRDAHGRKMSKSLGNVIDPISIIEGISLEGLHKTLYDGNLDPKEIEKAKEGQIRDYPKGIPECGTDALRFALCAYTCQDRNINLDVNRVVGYRNFCNKLWNAIKFALMNLGSDFKPPSNITTFHGESIWEKWILSRLHNAIKLCNDGFEKFNFSQVTTSIYNFWLYELCDVYLESMKPLLKLNGDNLEIQKKQKSAKETLFICLDNGLRLLHPFMPFVTEQLYYHISKKDIENYTSIMISPYPIFSKQFINETVESNIKFALDIIHCVRSLRDKFNLAKEKPELFINLRNEEMAKLIEDEMKEVINFLTNSSKTVILLNENSPHPGCAIEIVNKDCDIYLMIEGIIDIHQEIQKLESKLNKLNINLDKLKEFIKNPNYFKVADKVKEENLLKMEALEKEINNSQIILENLKLFLEK